MTQTVSFTLQREVQFRFLTPEDIPEIKSLCSDWFPIEYPDKWYQDITSNAKFFSLAATVHAKIIGIVVSEIKPRTKCNKEDWDILASHFPPSTQVAYILSLGVAIDYRRHGIASLLLDSLLSYLMSVECRACKAVYLHVLSTNNTAITFYERRNFSMHNFLPYYYSIQGKPRDGYCYVLYINGGQPPWTFIDYMKQVGSYLALLQPCALPRRLLRSARLLWTKLLGNGQPSRRPCGHPSTGHLS